MPYEGFHNIEDQTDSHQYSPRGTEGGTQEGKKKGKMEGRKEGRKEGKMEGRKEGRKVVREKRVAEERVGRANGVGDIASTTWCEEEREVTIIAIE